MAGAVRRVAAVPAVVVVLALVGSGPVRPARAGTATVPAQFVAKLYSEALGRMPDPGGWTAYIGDFQKGGCTPGMVQAMVRGFYDSGEFLSRNYDNQARVLALYRGAMNREPDQAGFDYWTGLLDRGDLTWAQVVDAFATSDELAQLTNTICGSGTSYYYGDTPAPTLKTSGSGFGGGTGEDLQQLLNAAPAGGTVYLAQKAVVRLTQMLDVPAGRTLATTAAPGPDSYALQGRLVRATSFANPMVRLESGARLVNVWVDGQRGTYTNYTLDAINVQTMGGSGTAVIGSKISNSRGWSSLQAFGSAEGLPCASTTVQGNLITAYSSEHAFVGGVGRLTDGLSIACEHSTIEDNSIIDATDVGIVLFRAHPAVQTSEVQNNTILSAGNSMYGAMGVDGLYSKGTHPDFTGAKMIGNTFWSSPDTHFDIGLAVGTRPWFGTRSDTSTGMTVTSNTTGGLTAVVGTGIAVSGMDNATVQGNDLKVDVRPIGNCPHVNIGDDADGYATGGDIQPGGVPVTFTNASGGGCITPAT